MPRRSSTAIFEELLATHEPRVREAFIEAVRDLVDGVTLRVVVERLERHDIEGAIAALNLEPEAFSRLERAIEAAYADGGQATVGNLPTVRDPDGGRVVFRFGIRNTPAEDWLRDHSGMLVTRIVDEQRDVIRTAFTEGLARGDNPTRTALDVVGRIDRQSNRRTGGVIGLSAPQERFVANARRELLSGDPDAMRNYLTRKRRDRRFDGMVLKAIREEKPLDRATIDRIVGRYSDNLLKLRGEAIGLNETMTALSKSREDAIAQQIAAGKIAAEDVVKVWRHTPQEHPRLHHRAMNNKTAPWGEKFKLPNGVEIDYPHAPDAPASETLFCKCIWLPRIDHIGAVARRYRATAA